jgi:hypothetical protein
VRWVLVYIPLPQKFSMALPSASMSVLYNAMSNLAIPEHRAMLRHHALRNSSSAFSALLTEDPRVSRSLLVHKLLSRLRKLLGHNIT